VVKSKSTGDKSTQAGRQVGDKIEQPPRVDIGGPDIEQA
jgi:hypothetical protein